MVRTIVLIAALVLANPFDKWAPLDLPKKIVRAPARIADDVLEVSTDGSAGGLIARLPPTPAAQLTWRWQVDRVLAKADLATKSGDDFAARVYVMFDYPLEKLPFGERVKVRIARLFYDQPLPLATLCYVWDNTHARGTIVPSAYTDRVRLIVLRNRDDAVHTWVDESRDLAADFRAAFGEDAPPVIGIAIAVDTDNTGERASARFGVPLLTSAP